MHPSQVSPPSPHAPTRFLPKSQPLCGACAWGKLGLSECYTRMGVILSGRWEANLQQCQCRTPGDFYPPMPLLLPG